MLLMFNNKIKKIVAKVDLIRFLFKIKTLLKYLILYIMRVIQMNKMVINLKQIYSNNIKKLLMNKNNN